jgi:NAD(P)H-flavin reductase
MLPCPYRVERVRQETPDTFTLDLAPENGARQLVFEPGQFNMLYAFGVGEVPISISGDPGKPGILVHTTREVGTVTRAMRKLKAGDSLGVRGPFGVGWPVTEARGADVVIVAGGIGLAPLRPALYQVLAARKYYGKVVLLYGTRTPADILFRRELQQWHSRFDLEVDVTVDRAMGDWRGNVGVVTSLIPRAPFDPHSAVAMICGPEVMMRFTVQELERRGVSLANIYISMERNMKCGIGLCGHCQLGPTFICKDGPVFPYHRIRPLLAVREM